MTITIEQGNFDAFFACPFAIYPDDDVYASPFEGDLRRILDSARNPLFREPGTGTFFTARGAGGLCGRITAHVHRAANDTHGLKRGYFGFFDCRDDADTARALLGAAEAWVYEHGYSEIAGNFNLTAMQQLGVVVDGFGREPYTDHIYSPPHVSRLLERVGYKSFFPMRTFEIDVGVGAAEQIREDALLARLPERISLRSPSRIRLSRFMQDARAVLNAGFVDNPMFVPLTAEEFDHQAREMRWIMDPDISLVAYEADEPIAVVVCIPDLNPFLRRCRSRLTWRTPGAYLRSLMTRRRAVLLFMAVTPTRQRQGIMAAMLDVLLSRLDRRGYTSLGVTWVADENRASLRSLERIGARTHHRLCLYRKDLH